ncbi:MAG TPA: hypothetical protein DIU35_11830, partial [Candidatus Latescibacteria bacterium]|nr:hypothetical protein [Candidatus Latescibacterota bacterium]
MSINIFKPFMPYLRRHWGRIALGLSLLAIAQATSTAIPYALMEAVDAIKAWVDSGATSDASPEGIYGQIYFYAAVILGLALLQMGLEMGMRWYLN